LQNEIAKYNNSLYNLKIEVDEGEINNQDDEDEITSLDNENSEEQ
jgi:hypothetical protein